MSEDEKLANKNKTVRSSVAKHYSMWLQLPTVELSQAIKLFLQQQTGRLL